MATLVLPDAMIVESIKFRCEEPHCCSDAIEDANPTLRVDFFDGGGGHYYELRGSDGFAFDAREAVNMVAGFLAICDHNDRVVEKWWGEEKRSEARRSTTAPSPTLGAPKRSDDDTPLSFLWLSQPSEFSARWEKGTSVGRYSFPADRNGNVLVVLEDHTSGLWTAIVEYKLLSGETAHSRREVKTRGDLRRFCLDYALPHFGE